MTKRPRGRCPVCSDFRSARWDGDALLVARHQRSGVICPGSGRQAPEDAVASR